MAVEYSIAIRVGDRSIIVRKNGKVIRRMKAAVGQVTHPTPPGRYAVTDRPDLTTEESAARTAAAR